VSVSPNKDVIRVAAAVRQALEEIFPRRLGLRNLCALSACAIVKMCARRRIRAKFVGGKFCCVARIVRPRFGDLEHIRASRDVKPAMPHAWVEHGKNYFDVTLTQFEETAEPVSVLCVRDPRYVGKEEHLDFAVAVLPLLGSSEGELRAVIDLAEKKLAVSPGKSQ
jgi:hypothetical protein